MSEVKRPRGRPITRVLPMPATVVYTEGCPGCRRDGYYHNACSQCVSRVRCTISCGRCHFKSNNKSSCWGGSDPISGWRCFKSNSSFDSRGESRPRRGRQQFMWELPANQETQLRAAAFQMGAGMKHSCKLFSGSLCRSELVSSMRWRSRENSVLVNRATFRRREKCGQHGGVIDGKVTQCEADLWCDSSEKEQAICSLSAATADFSVAFMLTPMTEGVFVKHIWRACLKM